jgi:uncharacterized protein
MIMQMIIAGMALGAVGSFHCVGMCGPLALALPVYHLSAVQKVVAQLLYNTGRVFTYTLLGLFFGMAGKGFSLAGWQQVFSIATGAIMLLLTILYYVFKKSFQPKWLLKFNGFIQKNTGRFLQQKNNAGYLLPGMVNGLLPCGMVYVAVAAALATGDAGMSALFMASFGLATLPAMLLVGIIGSNISLTVRARIKKLTPFVMIVVACLLIMRGMNLGIPYISPELTNQHDEIISCH